MTNLIRQILAKMEADLPSTFGSIVVPGGPDMIDDKDCPSRLNLRDEMRIAVIHLARFVGEESPRILQGRVDQFELYHLKDKAMDFLVWLDARSR